MGGHIFSCPGRWSSATVGAGSTPLCDHTVYGTCRGSVFSSELQLCLCCLVLVCFMPLGVWIVLDCYTVHNDHGCTYTHNYALLIVPLCNNYMR